MADFSDNPQRPSFELTDDIIDFFHSYSWPGNVRELKNVLGRLMLVGDWNTFKNELLGRETSRASQQQQDYEPSSPLAEDQDTLKQKTFPPLKEVKKRAIQEAEKELISAVLAETGWNRKRAAEILQISYKALLYKIKGLGLDRN